jgi:hypothetical protein
VPKQLTIANVISAIFSNWFLPTTWKLRRAQFGPMAADLLRSPRLLVAAHREHGHEIYAANVNSGVGRDHLQFDPD